MKNIILLLVVLALVFGCTQEQGTQINNENNKNLVDSNIPSTPFSGTFGIAIHNQIVATNNINNCSQLLDQNKIDACVFEISVKNKNKDWCASIVNILIKSKCESVIKN